MSIMRIAAARRLRRGIKSLASGRLLGPVLACFVLRADIGVLSRGAYCSHLRPTWLQYPSVRLDRRAPFSTVARPPLLGPENTGKPRTEAAREPCVRRRSSPCPDPGPAAALLRRRPRRATASGSAQQSRLTVHSDSGDAPIKCVSQIVIVGIGVPPRIVPKQSRGSPAFQSAPANFRTARIRSTATSGSRSRPARSASMKVSARCTVERPLSRPPTILK